MILELDAGNTRIKWRLISDAKDEGGGLLKEAGGFVLANKSPLLVFEELSLRLEELSFADDLRVRVSNVRGKDFGSALALWVRQKWKIQAEFAEVTKECGGVRNSYNDVSVMGVDRWLAMLAAYEDAKGLCCIVDCGSAITLDLIGSSGEHQGGYIVPGFSLMQEALAKKSSALLIGDELRGSTSLGRNTNDAVCNGMVCMVLGLLEGVNKQCQDDSGSLAWYLTGGDAALIAPYILWQHKILPELVMDGLAISMG